MDAGGVGRQAEEDAGLEVEGVVKMVKPGDLTPAQAVAEVVLCDAPHGVAAADGVAREMP